VSVVANNNLEIAKLFAEKLADNKTTGNNNGIIGK
jgi:hypothetical protein